MFKHFNVLDTHHFHHRYTDEEEMMRRRKLCFDSVAVIIQIKLMGVNKLFRAPKTIEKATYTMASLAKYTERYT